MARITQIRTDGGPNEADKDFFYSNYKEKIVT